MAAPNTKDWSARENAHKPKGVHLLVGGQVEVSSLNKAPQLAKTDSRDPKVLGLDLTIVETDEPDGDAMVWKGAHYHEEIDDDQYASVVIRWDGDVIERIDVVDDNEHHELIEAKVAEHNAAAAKSLKPAVKKPAPKKPAAKAPAPAPAPKKAAAKKDAPKKAAPKKTTKKTAKKKTAKKTSAKNATGKKKTAKKAAKKSSAKSTLKRFVKKLVKKLTPAKKKKKKR